MLELADVRRALRADGLDDKTIEAFFDNFQDSPEVWDEFEKITLDLINRGKRAGAKAIFEKVRWETEVEGGGEFKVCNSFTAYYGRVFELKYPEHAGFFVKKKLRGLHAA